MSELHDDEREPIERDAVNEPQPVKDEEVIAVAKAMDVNGDLEWDSDNHEHVVACTRAIEEAERFIRGFRAVYALESGQLQVYEPAASETAPENQTVPYADRDPIPSQ